MDNVPLGPVEIGVGLINLLLALVTLGTITYFWWKHHRAGLNRAWWVLAIAFAAFVVAQSLEYRSLLISPNQLSTNSLEITARTVFVCAVSLGLWRLFNESLKAKQRSLDAAEATIQLMRLQAETARQGNELNLLLKISHLITSKSDLRSLLEELCRSTREALKARSVWVRLRQPLASGFQSAADHPPGDSGLAAISPRIESVCAEVARTGKAVTRETNTLTSPGDPQARYVFIAGFPLMRRDEVVGTLVMGYETAHTLSPDEQRLAKGLADQAAVAIVQAHLAEQAEHNSRIDNLTGLPNRQQFNEALRAEARRASRYRLPLALMLIHLSKLREYNKAFGQSAGDAYLKFFAQHLRGCSRESDLIARLGDDEFVIIMPNTTLERVHQAAERLRKNFLEAVFEWEQNRLSVTAAIGCAGWGPGEAAEPDALLAAASRALSGALSSPEVIDGAKRP
jgi:diguanylate cyclase (GGDEF)-like protein